MPVGPGSRLAHYEIVSLLGRGGMGEVWAAKDTKLGRDVAIKILPDEFTTDPERLARFEREARVLASLDHPGIASIHGIEEADGVRFLVMQLAAGEDLADRLARGPIPVDEAIPIAIRIAEALEAAHDRGVVHRDLKPANIKIDTDGNVRILDFGLAKALETEEADEDFSNSPTMIRAATHAGVILGTAAYMSPEQARGKRVDKRADIWAFGVILWEILTGKRMFVGDTVSDTLAAVLKEDPDFDALPTETPASVRRVIRRCLEKNPGARLHDIADARIELADASVDGSEALAGAAPLSKKNPLMAALPWAIAVLAIVVAAWAWLGARHAAAPVTPMYAKLAPPEGNRFVVTSGFAISPDGRHVTYGAQSESGTVKLWVESLDDGTARAFEGTEGAQYPFWSPDGTAIGFFADEKLEVLHLANSAVEALADAPGRTGGTWNSKGTIVFGGDAGLQRIPATGGEPAKIETGEKRRVENLFPSFLPDGSHFLYELRHYYDSEPKRELRVESVDGGPSRLVARIDSNAILAPSGDLVWWENGNLRAQRFDLERLELTGEPRVLAANVQFDPRFGVGMFSIARNGTLVLRKGGIVAGDQLARVDRQGHDLGPIGAPGNFYGPRLSPDGTRVVVDRSDETNRGDIWIYDVDRGTGTRLTTDPVDESSPFFSPDGEKVVFYSGLGGKPTIQIRSLHGVDDQRKVYEAPDAAAAPTDWSSNGYIVFATDPPGATTPFGYGDLRAFSLKDGKAFPVATTKFTERSGVVSPSGRFVAYDSDETGQPEVYVQTFPEPERRWRVSTAGGSGPAWNRNGKELYFVSPRSELVAVPIRGESAASSLEFGAASVLFKLSFKGGVDRPFDTLDGKTFIVNRRFDDLDPTPLTLVIDAFGPNHSSNAP